MKFNVYYHIQGPGGSIRTPDVKNPIEEENLSILMHSIAPALKPSEDAEKSFRLQVIYIGIEILPVEE